MFEYAAHYGQLVEIVDIDCSLDEIPANENGNLVELAIPLSYLKVQSARSISVTL